ncbi:hypothetical protein JHK87_039450 [Glycine soja]|nr:hypothetical protein JHK87_039450 [Glycine soja]
MYQLKTVSFKDYKRVYFIVRINTSPPSSHKITLWNACQLPTACCVTKIRADDRAAMQDFILSVKNTSNKRGRG